MKKFNRLKRINQDIIIIISNETNSIIICKYLFIIAEHI